MKPVTKIFNVLKYYDQNFSSKVEQGLGSTKMSYAFSIQCLVYFPLLSQLASSQKKALKAIIKQCR